MLAAILCGAVGSTVKADTIQSGIFYDVGKETYSGMQNPHSDWNYCWAATGANLLQYWMDTYESECTPSRDTYPVGVVEATGPLAGTAYLSIYQDILEKGKVDTGAFTYNLFDWYFYGSEVSAGGRTVLEQDSAGYFKYDSIGEMYQSGRQVISSGSALLARLRDNMAYQGVATGLQVMAYNASGALVMNHEISCWGYDERNGRLESVIVTDSDDGYFGAIRLDVKYDSWGSPIMLTDNQSTYFGRGCERNRYCISSTDYIVMPAGMEKYANTMAAPGTIDGNKVETNTRLVSLEERMGGVTVGDGQNVVVLAGTAGSGLTLQTDFETVEAGLHVRTGAMAAVDNLGVWGFMDSGVVAEGHVYVNHGSFEAMFNCTAGNGGGVLNNTYVELVGNTDVTFGYNMAGENGGAIYNKGTVSIRGNDMVFFSDNQAWGDQGDDIYNAAGGTVSIADNGYTLFLSGEGRSSITNRGRLYLAAREGNVLAFFGGHLDSADGDVYIGRDVTNRCSGQNGAVTFQSVSAPNTWMEVSALAEGGVAHLKNVMVDGYGVSGVNGTGLVEGALFSSETSLTFASLQMVDVQATAAMITLDNVNLTASGSLFSSTGSLTLVDAVIDVTGLGAEYDFGSLFKYESISGTFSFSGLEDGAQSDWFTISDDLKFESLFHDYALGLYQKPEEQPGITVTPDVEDTPVVETTPESEVTVPAVDGDAVVDAGSLDSGLVVDSLVDPELTLQVETPDNSVTLGEGEAVALSPAETLTQTVETPAETEVALPDDADTALTLQDGTVESAAEDLLAAVDQALVEQQAAADQVAQEYEKATKRNNNRRPRGAEFGDLTGAAALAEVGLLAPGAAGSADNMVPEPATGTLSLLALAGLVARRRRK